MLAHSGVEEVRCEEDHLLLALHAQARRDELEQRLPRLGAARVGHGHEVRVRLVVPRALRVHRENRLLGR